MSPIIINPAPGDPPSVLLLANNSVSSPQTLDLSRFMNVQRGEGMDPYDPQYSEKVWSRSILREGATLALENLHEKALVFPLLLNSTSTAGLMALVAQVNQIVRTPGATCSWQDVGCSQPTVFDLLSGELEIDYDYRANQQHWLRCKLHLFSQPLGRAAAPRAYAAGSAVGPLLMLSPYASTGGQAIGASTQAGVAGWGGAPQGASSGVFYSGSPSLAGDAPAQLQVSYVGPLPSNATNTGQAPTAMVSLLPDGSYWPLRTTADFTFSQGVLPTWIGANAPAGVAVDGAHVYWANIGNNAIARANLDGTSPSQSWITGANAPAGVAVDAAHVYWTQAGTLGIGRANLDGTSPSQLWIGGVPNSPAGVAVDAAHVYWTQGGAVGRANLDGTSPSQTWLSGGSQLHGVAVDGAHVYWANGAQNTIGRANLDGTSPSQAWITGAAGGVGPAGPAGVAVDTGHVYWANNGGNAIARANLDGTGPNQSWITSANGPNGVAVDGSHIYWANAATNFIARANLALAYAATAIASSYVSYPTTATTTTLDTHLIPPLSAAASGVPVAWAGSHRLFAIARASGAGYGLLTAQPNSLTAVLSSASVPATTDWQPYDLGTFTLHPSETPQAQLAVTVGAYTTGSIAMDVSAYVMLPDATTWYLNPQQVTPSSYGYPANIANLNRLAQGPYSNTILLDDVLGDQFLYSGQSQTSAPSPIGMAQLSGRVTQYARGLVPRPDPRNGLPALAILALGQCAIPSTTYIPGASWANPQNLQTMAQVNVLERARYTLP